MAFDTDYFSRESLSPDERAAVWEDLKRSWSGWLPGFRSFWPEPTRKILWRYQEHMDKALWESGLTWLTLREDLELVAKYPLEVNPEFEHPIFQSFHRLRSLEAYVKGLIEKEAQNQSTQRAGKYDGLNIVSRGVQGLSRRHRRSR